MTLMNNMMNKYQAFIFDKIYEYVTIEAKHIFEDLQTLWQDMISNYGHLVTQVLRTRFKNRKF